jgi:hypothetical protein
VRQRQESLGQPEIVKHLECGWMNGVAAKIAQKIAVFLEHDDVDAGPCEQIAQHRAGRSAPGDAAACP